MITFLSSDKKRAKLGKTWLHGKEGLRCNRRTNLKISLTKSKYNFSHFSFLCVTGNPGLTWAREIKPVQVGNVRSGTVVESCYSALNLDQENSEKVNQNKPFQFNRPRVNGGKELRENDRAYSVSLSTSLKLMNEKKYYKKLFWFIGGNND